MFSINVVIPVLNESGHIVRCLEQFRGATSVGIVVVDGGSSDSTPDQVAETGLATLIQTDRSGRARQMNLGARASDGEILLFLHADTLLPEQGLQRIAASLEDPGVAGGRFRLELQEAGWRFRLISRASTWRSRFLGITYGDQGIFCRRNVFEAVGGFPDLEIFEDSEFCRLLQKEGRFILIDAPVRSSARRWRRSGVCFTVLWMWILRVLFELSVSDRRLSQWYRNVR